jgi:RNA polymerase sigma factor (sigma-70 family)
VPEHADNLPAPDLRRLLAELHPESWGWALRCCHGQHHIAEDVLQRSYQKILSGRARFSGNSSFKTWLFGAIRFTALDQRRWNVRHWLRFLPLPDDEPALATTGDFPGESFFEAEQDQALRDALARLASRQAEVLHLVFYHDLTLDEAAAVMRVSPGTARTHYERGKASLRSLLVSQNPVQ